MNTVLAQLLGTDTAVRFTVNGCMPLSVEDIGQSGDGNRLIAISHYGEQNGDLMRDPEVVLEDSSMGWLSRLNRFIPQRLHEPQAGDLQL